MSDPFYRRLAAKIETERARVIEGILNIGPGEAIDTLSRFHRMRGVIAGFDEVLQLCDVVEQEMSGRGNASEGRRGQPSQ